MPGIISLTHPTFSHGAIGVVRHAHGVVVDAQPGRRGAELLLDLRRQGVQVAVAGEDEGAVVVDYGGGGAPRDEHVVVGRRVRHVPVVLDLQRRQHVPYLWHPS